MIKVIDHTHANQKLVCFGSGYGLSNARLGDIELVHLSKDAMLTSVATASEAVGGTPTVWRPQGSKRDSISIRRRYTLPTTLSRS